MPEKRRLVPAGVPKAKAGACVGEAGRGSAHVPHGKMKVAVAGCCHGALDKLYETLQLLEQRHGVDARPDLLLCAGDFQAVRNAADLRCMAVPSKYRQLGGFAK